MCAEPVASLPTGLLVIAHGIGQHMEAAGEVNRLLEGFLAGVRAG